MKSIYRYCNPCQKVVRVDIPECSHVGQSRRTANGSCTTVVYRGPNGEIHTPWSVNSPVPKGYKRVELSGLGDLKRFEREMNQRECDRHADYVERQERSYLAAYRDNERKQLLHDMQSMSPMGRRIAEEAIRRSNAAPSRARYDPGFRREK